MRKRPCLLFACIFLTGIVFQRYEWKALIFILLGFLALEIYHGVRTIQESGKDKFLHKKFGRIAGRSLVLLSAFFLGMCHMKSQETYRDTYMSKLQDNSNVVIFGELIKIEKTEYGSRLLLTDCYVSLTEATVPCNKVMVYASSDHFRVGQIYQIKGQLHFFENARNEGNFDSAVFYQSQKIDFFLYEEESFLLDSNENQIRDWILELKSRMEQVYQNSFDEDAAGFYMGMMLGDKSLLSDRTKDLFALGGISHVLAISGLHMSIIGRGFYKQLRKGRIGFLPAGLLAGLLLVAYCFMVGNGTSAIRAVGMMLLYFLAQYVGRSYDMLNAFGAVVIYLLWENPFLIEYSGFWFSVTALIGVGFVGQTLANSAEVTQSSTNPAKLAESEKRKMRVWNSIKSSLWMSMGITLSTLPIVAYCYYEVPLYSPLVNSIVLPILSPIFVLAIFGALIGCVIPFVGMVMLIPCEWLFHFYEFICEFVENLPFGSIITGMPEIKVVVGYYLVLLLGCLFIRRQGKGTSLETKQQVQKSKQRKSESRFVDWSWMEKFCDWRQILLSMICFAFILWPRTPKSEVIFLDVGQGDGIYIGSEDGTTLFIDGGSSDINQVGTYRIIPFLKAHGVSHIDYWFVSHADKDHISGLLEVLEDDLSIGSVVISAKMPENENKEQLLATAHAQGVSVLYMNTGDQIASESIRVNCLYPWETGEDANEQSMVLVLDYLDETGEQIFRGLFSGDISSETESYLLKRYDGSTLLSDINLYKAAHHGSKYSNSLAFLEKIQPEYCVISCGIDNSYGHPHAETLEVFETVGCEIQSTTEYGQVVIEIPSKMKY